MSKNRRQEFDFSTCGMIGLIFSAAVFVATLVLVIWFWIYLDFSN